MFDIKLGENRVPLWTKLLTSLLLALLSVSATAERIKDLASLQGVRNNQLVGYGLVVGLDGSGDQTTQTPFTTQSIINMLAQLGTTLPTTQSLQLKNVAAVMVTAVLPPFARIGQQIDVTVSSMGNAKSLRGGTLVMTPLKGADGQIYAQAQGNLLVGGAGAASGGSKVTVNHLLAGRIAGGATVEREVPTALGQGSFVHYEMGTTDFATTQKVVEVINREIGPGTAEAVDGRLIRVSAPQEANSRVAFLGRVESLEVRPAKGAARVIINPRTGSVVMNQTVTIDSCAVAHGNLSVVINSEQKVSQPNALAGGQTVATTQSDIDVRQSGGSLLHLKAGVNLAEVVKAVNALGAGPLDLLSILQSMKAAGALRAELEII
ncbi:MAG TPA: flagellar basal body P-ring protein FlgI [Accumulibacter sp.]|uniref:flagellar basal body P-ring protein FlgI n=1 Tax=Accumulibacter sp. TaxID=2053492 RepID=UPI0028789888|nr:flagellar basal body P-ring protein FlgI [Accumulibacter sp.]MDS4056110.1 flagellar basal body P-ring protein FlgI [Accumulibacter sp.]HMV04007.1 flagellar basal body P-ring protein FlgI [Accumulibacter sp.]HMW62357.1 flagellar basal body P-ring protein FlgI [Accumulibacter sp.]HMW78763.1 flagellar basal body P-ring protein FlgI [Accumulibacter sp.]HMX67581.1 flagellar basal body P-ring protein FlgI [Accumulibacter sp.]